MPSPCRRVGEGWAAGVRAGHQPIASTAKPDICDPMTIRSIRCGQRLHSPGLIAGAWRLWAAWRRDYPETACGEAGVSRHHSLHPVPHALLPEPYCLRRERQWAPLHGLMERTQQPLPRSRFRRPGGVVASVGRVDAITPPPVCGQAMRTEFGRPSSSMRLRTWTATSTSAARRSSVCERSPSPITCLKRAMLVSARARLV